MVEIISVEASRLTSLFRTTSPGGQTYLPQVIQSLTRRYEFADAPTRVEELSGDFISFKHGRFEGVGIRELKVYNDGVFIESGSDSDVLDAFLQDAQDWMEKEIGLKRFETHTIRTNYESSLIVRSSEDILRPIDAVAPIQDLISAALHDATGLGVKFEPFSMAWAADTSKIPGLSPIPFRIERNISLEFETNYYVSAAPLRTKDHIRVLEKLEDLTTQKKARSRSVRV